MNLDPKISRFDWPTARVAAHLCTDAYGRATISDVETDTHCLVAEFQDCFALAFRGSASVKNWIEDAEFKRTLFLQSAAAGHVEVHEGFFRCYDSIIVALSRLLGGSSVFKYQNCKPLFVFGHSLGGALAILAALELNKQGFSIAQVITFGAPRVGNKNFARLYDSVLRPRTFRIVNQNDIVPRLPFWITGYRHCGQEVFLPVGNGWSLNPPLWTKVISDALGLYGAYRHLDEVLVRDHFIETYEQRIQLLQ